MRTPSPQPRWIVALMTTALATGTATSCLPLPSRPAEHRLELSVQSGEAWFQWCAPVSEHRNMRISFREDGAIFTAYEGLGRFVLESGDEFSISVPPLGLATVGTSRPIPIDDRIERVYVSSNLAVYPAEGGSAAANDEQYENVGRSIEAVFDVEEALAVEGLWLRYDGTTAQEPCARDSDVRL